MKRIVAERAGRIDASGIRKVFALAAEMKDPINFSIGQPDFDLPDEIKAEAIRAIEEGRIQHEARDEVDEKNLLLTGEVTASQVAKLLRACRGTQYDCTPHHVDPSIEVHVFKPETRLNPNAEKKRWYIKLYLLEPDVWFISVHESTRSRP